jgi:hypothetical protein
MPETLSSYVESKAKGRAKGGRVSGPLQWGLSRLGFFRCMNKAQLRYVDCESEMWMHLPHAKRAPVAPGKALLQEARGADRGATEGEAQRAQCG